MNNHDREELIVAAVRSWNEPLGKELEQLFEHRRHSAYYARRTIEDLQKRLDASQEGASHVHD